MNGFIYKCDGFFIGLLDEKKPFCTINNVLFMESHNKMEKEWEITFLSTKTNLRPHKKKP